MVDAARACAVGGSVGHFHPGFSDTGVVICAPLGFENLTTRLGVRSLADRLATVGLHTLRFDYHGEGDAPGSDLDPDRWAAWLQSTRDAIAWMRDCPGVKRIAVVGMRLGATVAVHALSGSDSVAQLVLLSPVLEGRKYVREMQARAAITTMDRPVDQWPIDTMGFRLSEATCEDLRRIRIDSADRVAERVLCLVGESGSSSKRYAVLSKICDSLDIVPYKGEAEFFNDPLLSCPPDEAFTSIVAQLSQGINKASDEASDHCSPAVVRGDGYSESAVSFGTGSLLAGVLCKPDEILRERLAVVFLNNGRTDHIGQGRTSVEQARALAAAGIASLRFDVAGLGESQPKPDRSDIVAYDPKLGDDVSVALDFLEEEGYSRFLLVGLCSGANLAFHAAAEDERIGGIFLANLVRFVFNPESIQSILEVSWRGRPNYYRETMLQPAFWRAVLAGKVAIAPKLLVIVRWMTSKLRNVIARATPRFCKSDLVTVRQTFERLARRNVDVTLAYAEGDSAYSELERYMGKDGCRLRCYASMRQIVLADADHLFLAGEARARLREEILQFALKQARVPNGSIRPGDVRADQVPLSRLALLRLGRSRPPEPDKSHRRA